jgi:hypothetical protein
MSLSIPALPFSCVILIRSLLSGPRFPHLLSFVRLNIVKHPKQCLVHVEYHSSTDFKSFINLSNSKFAILPEPDAF